MKQPLHQTYIDLDKVITAANFPNNVARIRDIARRAFQNLEENLASPYDLHGETVVSKDNFGAPLPKGQRDETLLRHHLIAELYRIWELGHNEVPVINNKKSPVRPFVVFVEQIFYLLDIGKVDQHLESFQIFRKKQFKESGLL
jgi:hypothetical protein